MKRREFIQTAVIGGLGFPLLGRAASPVGAKPIPGGSPPVVAAPTADSVVVLWAVDTLSVGWVEYGETAALGLQARGTAGPGFTAHGERTLRVPLTGLQPGRRYYARTVTTTLECKGGYKRGPEQRSNVFSFTTPNPAATSTDIAVWNDTHDRQPTLQALYALTVQRRPDILVWNGDISNNINDEAKIPGLYLGPGGGLNLAELAPLCLVRGNHDVRGAFAYRLADYSATPDGRPYYALRMGPVAALFLDTGEDKADDHPTFGGLVAFDALRREQGAWLQKIIKQPGFCDAPYRVAFCHIPLHWVIKESEHDFDRMSERSRKYWHSALVEWGTQVVVSGHTHKPAWLPPDKEYPYSQMTGGGPTMETATLLRLHADANGMKLSLRDLQGRELEAQSFKPLA